MLPGADQQWRRRLDPEVAGLGVALVELMPHHPDVAFGLMRAGLRIVVETEKFRPDLLELNYAWDCGRIILVELHDAGRASMLAVLVLEEMERVAA